MSNTFYTAITLDYLNKQVYLINHDGLIFSLNYDGGNQRRMIGILQPRVDFFALDIYRNTLFFQKTDLLGLDVHNRNISRYIPLPENSTLQNIIVIDKSRQPNGKSQCYTIVLCAQM